MTEQLHFKEFHGVKYFTGNHPEIRSHFQSGHRPKEFGNKVWATSLVLIQYLHSHSVAFNNLRVLEIGCGWGLLGVYLAKHFQCQVTCTDLDENVLPIVQKISQLNDVTLQTKRAAFSELSQEFLQNFDLMVGAEVCYSEEVAKEISKLLVRAQKAHVQQTLIADPGRPGFRECSELSFEHSESELHTLPGTINGKVTTLLSIRAKN